MGSMRSIRRIGNFWIETEFEILSNLKFEIRICYLNPNLLSESASESAFRNLTSEIQNLQSES